MNTQPQATSENRIYRGRTIQELLPKIREELGADAIVVAQREGLAGGVGGFFQHPYVEIEARPGDGPAPAPVAPRFSFDAYDIDGDDSDARAALEEPLPSAADLAFAEHLNAAAISDDVQRLVTAFAEANTPEAQAPAPEATPVEPQAVEPQAVEPPVVEPQAVEPQVVEPQVVEPQVVEPPVVEPQVAAPPLAQPQAPEAPAAEVPAPAAAPAPDPDPVTREKRAEQYIARLVDAGLSATLAADVVDETLSHSVPFGPPRQLKRLVRATLARRISVEAGFRGRRRAIAIVGAPGSGKSLVAHRLAAAYENESDLPVRHFEFGQGDVWPRDAEGFAVVDTPGVSRTQADAIAALAAQLDTLELDEIHLALPATLSRAAAAELLDALAPLNATRLVLTHADETEHVAPVVGLAVERGIPFSFLSFGDALPVGLVPADAHDLAGRVLG